MFRKKTLKYYYLENKWSKFKTFIYICQTLIRLIMGRIIILILMHLVGDFFLQGQKLSKLKALKLPYLVEHVGIYTLLFIVLSPVLLGLTFLQGLVFSLLNGSLHFIIDYFTGKFKAKYIDAKESKFLTTIGIDHTLHIIILIVSYIYLYPNAINTFTPFLKY